MHNMPVGRTIRSESEHKSHLAVINWKNTYDSKTPDNSKSWFANEDYNKNSVRHEQRRAHV
jgi:hypothetical protein